MRAAWLLGLIPLAVAPFACTSAFTTAPGDGGGGLGASATGNGGFGNTTTDMSSVGGGGGIDRTCSGLDDCDPAPVCRTVACTNSRCVYGFVLPNTPVSPQVANDCAVENCDGAGHLTKDATSLDALNDHPAGTTCLGYRCMGGNLVEAPATEQSKTPCSDDGGAVCDGAGNCVECTSDMQCGGLKPPVCAGNKCVPNGCEEPATCAGHVPQCPPCADGAVCATGADCASQVCAGSPVGTCATAACPDEVQNGFETDLDCGGPDCTIACADHKGCRLDRDCISKKCGADDTCTPASCSDQTQNGQETDADCGGGAAGSTCRPCSDGRKCLVASDCEDNGCNTTTGKCDHCVNGKLDPGLEAGVDCGMDCSEKCKNGTPCTDDDDCASTHCCANPTATGPGSTGGPTMVCGSCQ